MSEVKRFADLAALTRAAAVEFAELARAAVQQRGRFCVALSGGSTPRGLYAALAERPFREQIDWQRIEVFWGDERPVPPDDPESNYGMAWHALLGEVGIPAERIHRIRGERPDVRQAAREYQEEIARVFAIPADGAPPRFDLILLGMGPDGHTASLFSHSEALGERQRWVVGHHVPSLRTDRITLTYPVLDRGREIRLLVAGSDKAATLHDVLEGPRDPERLPVQGVVPDSGRLIWMIDTAAAAKLGRTT